MRPVQKSPYMSTEPKSPLYPLESLHDFQPKKRWLQAVWGVVWGSLAFLMLFLQTALSQIDPHSIYFVLVFILFFVVLAFGITLFLVLKQGTVLTNWDDLDYSGFTKRDFPFEPADGHKVFSYCYILDGIDITSAEKRYPVIISFHGLNSHHREMDRYCLPSTKKMKCLYFTLDAYGHGQSPGNKKDFRQVSEAREFIAKIASLPYVDRSRIAVVGMSMGAGKAMLVAYPHPDVKAVVALSGPYDFVQTKRELSRLDQFVYKLVGVNLKISDEMLKANSAIYQMKKDGIVLRGQSSPTPNKDRVFLLANEHDPLVKVWNTKKAIEALDLPPENYHIYQKGDHNFTGNEYFLSVEIYDFLRTHL